MRSFFVLSLLMIFSVSIQASETDTDFFDYFGSTEEVNRTLQSDEYRTVYREVEVPATCTREVPYQDQVCSYETRYRRSCQQEPRSRQVCRNVTRYRQQCSGGGGGGQVCRTKPVCRQVNGRRVCRRERVCTNRPGTPRVCRKVPYTERVCRTETTYERVCRQVPYQDRVCRYVTRYRTESYACTRYESRPFRELVSRNDASVRFLFNKAPDVTDISARFNLTLNGPLLSVVSNNGDSYDENIFVAAVDESRSQDGLNTYINSTYKVFVMNKTRFLSPVSNELRVRPETMDGFLKAKIGKAYYNKTLQFSLNVQAEDGRNLFSRSLTREEVQLTAAPNDAEKSRVKINLAQLLEGRATRGEQLKVRLDVSLNLGNKRVLNEGSLPRTKLSKEKFVIFR